MTYLILAVALFYFMFQKSGSGGLNDLLSSIEPSEILPLLNMLGVDGQTLNSVLSILPDLLSGNLKPADIIKKAAPLIAALSLKNQNGQKTNAAESYEQGEGLTPVSAFIPADLKNEFNAFFE